MARRCCQEDFAVDVQFYLWVMEYSYAKLSMKKYPLFQKWLGLVCEMGEVKEAYEKIAKGEKA